MVLLVSLLRLRSARVVFHSNRRKEHLDKVRMPQRLLSLPLQDSAHLVVHSNRYKGRSDRAGVPQRFLNLRLRSARLVFHSNRRKEHLDKVRMPQRLLSLPLLDSAHLVHHNRCKERLDKARMPRRLSLRLLGSAHSQVRRVRVQVTCSDNLHVRHLLLSRLGLVGARLAAQLHNNRRRPKERSDMVRIPRHHLSLQLAEIQVRVWVQVARLDSLHLR